MTPPRFPRWLLRRAAPPEDRAALIGDLDEEFRTRSGWNATAWYWTQALASVPSAVRLRWQRAAPLTDLSGDIRRALRMIARRPAFAAAAIATMALGAGITTAVVSIAEAILFRPLPYANASRLLAIHEIDAARRGHAVSWPDFVELSERLRTFSAIAAYNGSSRTLSGLGPPERVGGVSVTAGFFDVLGVRPALGRVFTGAELVAGGPRVVMLSSQSWRRRFGGNPDAVGRSITLSGVPHTIVGVLPESFVFPLRGDPELWLPLFPPAPGARVRPEAHSFDVIGAHRPDVSRAAALDELRAHAQEWNRSGQPWHAATSLTAVGLRDDMVSSVRPALLIVLGAAFLVLFASAVNVSGLILSRAAARSGELSVRTALGATRWRIVRELGVESICIAAIGSALGLALGAWAVAIFRATTPLRFRAMLPFADHLGVSSAAAAASVAATVVAVLAAGLMPALRSGGMRNPLLASTRTTAGRSETRLRRGLVAAQLAFAVVLLVGAALIGRSALNLARVTPGFAIDGLAAARMNLPGGRDGTPEQIVAAADRILDRVGAVPGIAGVEIINRPPLGGRSGTGDFTSAGRTGKSSLTPLIRSVSPGYFRLTGIPVVEGRGFDRTDGRTSPRVAVLNQTLARTAFAGRSPIGERIVFEFLAGRPEWAIVGVVGDEQFDALDSPMAPVVYLPFAQSPSGEFSIVVRAAAPAAIIPSVRAALAEIEPDLPLYEVQTLADTAAQSNAMFLRTLVTRLLVWFALATLLLGGVGIYGVLSEAVAARRKEIGLRFALGASQGAIARHVLATGAVPAAIGLIIGFAAAAAAASFVRSLLFGVTPLDVPSFLVVAAVLAAVTLLACAGPAIRAMRLPIATALRQE